MKAKIQIGIGLFVAMVIGIGIIITANDHSYFGDVHLDLGLGVSTLLGLLVAYAFTLIIKKRILGRIIFLIWCVGWVISFVLDLVMGISLFSDDNVFLLVLWAWPSFVFRHFYGMFPFGEFGGILFNVIFFVLVTVLLWIGFRGVSHIIKAENKSSKKLLPEQKDK